MADKSLTILIKGDAKDLEASVIGADGSLTKLEQSSDRTNTKLGGLSDGLGKVGTAATVGFAAVGAAGIGAAAGLYAIGSNFDDAFDKIRVGTGATGDSLAGLQDDFKGVVSNTAASFEDASTAITNINQKLGTTGQPLQDLSTQFLNLSRITGTDVSENIDKVTGLFNNWGVSADQQGPKLDELYRASQATGVSVSDLSDSMASNGTVLRQSGYDFESSAALLGTLSKAGLDAGDVMPALGKALATAGKAGKDASAMLDDVFANIQNAPTDTAAAGVAMETFGAKAGPKLAAMIREGKLSIGDLRATIAGGSDTINSAGADTEDFAEKWQKFTNKLQVLVEPIATKVFGAVGNAIDAITPYLMTAGQWLSDNLPGAFAALQSAAQPVIDWLVNAWPTVVSGLQTVGNAIAAAWSWLMENKDVLIGTLVGVGAALAVMGAIALATAIAELAVAAVPLLIIAAIGLLVGALVWAYNHWEGFRNVINAVVDWVKVNVPPMWDAFLAGIQTIRDWLVNTLFPALASLGETVGSVFDTIENVVQIAWDVLKNVGVGIWGIFNGVADVAQIMMGVVVGAWNGIWSAAESVLGFLGSIPDRLRSAFSTVADAISAPFRSAFQGIKDIWNSTIGGKGFTTPDWLPFGAGGKSFTIPTLHTGGTYRSPFGASEGFALLRDGEKVVTPGGSGGSTPDAVPAGGGGGGPMIVIENLTVQTLVPDRNTGRVILESINDAARSGIQTKIPASVIG